MNLFKKPICITALTLCLLLPTAGYGESIMIQSEDTLATHNIMFLPITATYYPGCTGTVLEGLDCEDEWAEYALNVNDFGQSRFTLQCRGAIGVTCHFEVTFTGNQSGSEQTIDVEYVGLGYG
jgi:hypothetical protein